MLDVMEASSHLMVHIQPEAAACENPNTGLIRGKDWDNTKLLILLWPALRAMIQNDVIFQS